MIVQLGHFIVSEMFPGRQLVAWVEFEDELSKPQLVDSMQWMHVFRQKVSNGVVKFLRYG